ncbi:MAG: YiiX/YebB-like N1pC/P60 family cysteine hydrolase [Lactovum sp.]
MRESLKTGDFIVSSSTLSDFDQAILNSSQEKKKTYTHIGMIERKEKEIYVWHSSPLKGVCLERLDSFILSEEEKDFDIFRLIEKVDFYEILAQLEKRRFSPYNFSFIKSNQAYYCSELLVEVFPKGIFKEKEMRFIGSFWSDYFEKLKMEIPENERGSHPNDLMAQKNIQYIGKLSK